MSIILHEKEWTEGVIASKQLGAKPYITLSRVARYFRQIDGYKKSEVRKKVEEFLLQCSPGENLSDWDKRLDDVVKWSDKRPLVDIDGVAITEHELYVINTLTGRQQKRLAFTLLCLAKYRNIISEVNNNWTGNYEKGIMSMANINTSSRRKNQMFHEIMKAGLIKFSKEVDNLNNHVLFINYDSSVVIHIRDYRNLGNQYMLYCGEPYFKCAQCGLTIKRKHNAQKYCSDCAAEMYIKKSVESVMRQRINAVLT